MKPVAWMWHDGSTFKTENVFDEPVDERWWIPLYPTRAVVTEEMIRAAWRAFDKNQSMKDALEAALGGK